MFPIMGIETKQPMDLTIPRIRSICRKGGKEAKELAKEREARKAWVIKPLEKHMLVMINKPTNYKGALNSRWGT
jgi:hypothetical protein